MSEVPLYQEAPVEDTSPRQPHGARAPRGGVTLNPKPETRNPES